MIIAVVGILLVSFLIYAIACAVDSPAPSKPKPTNTNNNMDLEQRLKTINGIIDRADNQIEPLPMSAYVFFTQERDRLIDTLNKSKKK